MDQLEFQTMLAGLANDLGAGREVHDHHQLMDAHFKTEVTPTNCISLKVPRLCNERQVVWGLTLAASLYMELITHFAPFHFSFVVLPLIKK